MIHLVQRLNVASLTAGLCALMLCVACSLGPASWQGESAVTADGAGHPSAATVSTQLAHALPAPLRFASVTQFPSSALGKDFIAAAGWSNISINGDNALFQPQYVSAAKPGLNDAAYGVYGLGLSAGLADTALTLTWDGSAPAIGTGWLGLSDRTRQRWNWRPLDGTQFTLSAAQQYVDSSGNVYAAIVVLGVQPSALSRIALSASPGGAVILGRPTATSICISYLGAIAGQGWIRYGQSPDQLDLATVPQALPAGEPVEYELNGLLPDTRYYYCMFTKTAGGDPVASDTAMFHTQRAPGSSFTFEIMGDSHPERTNNQFDPALYSQTLRAAAADQPDFYMTIGDDFSVDTLATETLDNVRQIYLNQRNYLSLVARSAALFLVNGNHEQAALPNLDGTPDNVAVWAQNARNNLFPLPAPDGFYRGDEQSVDFIGLLRDYYAWTWGDALFIVLDPYWHSPISVDVDDSGVKPDLWEMTLGDAQYAWLKQTLEQSSAKYKFVFAHHVHGTNRGGIELANLYEWGGYDKNGTWRFAEKRPGWPLTIQQLLAQNGVTIFFQGHDHVFAHQELDGVVYQTLPEPADPNYALYFADKYLSGDLLPNSGRVRVRISGEAVKVEYVRSYLPQDATLEHPDGEIAFAYTIPAG
jgi:hypothetical protein